MHWRRSMSERAGLGGLSTDAPATLGSYAPSDSNPLLPSGSILEPFEVSEPPVHKFQLFERALLFVLTAVALVSAVFLLFVET